MASSKDSTFPVHPPSSSLVKLGTVTPHKLTVMLLIKEFCIVRTQDKGYYSSSLVVENHVCQYTPEKVTPHQRRDFCLLALQLIQVQDMDLLSLKSKLENPDLALPPDAIKGFWKNLKKCVNTGIAGLLDLIKGFELLLTETSNIIPPALHRSSVIGLHLRHILLSCDKMTFSHMVSLCNALSTYCSYLEKDTDHVEELHNQMSQVSLSDTQNAPLWTKRQADLFLAQQSQLLEMEEVKAMKPPLLQDSINQLIKGHPTMGEVHYLSFLNCLRAKECRGGELALHQAFDRVAGSSTGGDESKTKNLRHAALNLTALYAASGHQSEAEDALKEAVELSQDAGDAASLQQCVGWASFLRPFPVTSKATLQPLLKCLSQRSGDLSQWHLSILGSQMLSLSLSHTYVLPATVMSQVAIAELLSVQHSQHDSLAMTHALKASLALLWGSRVWGFIESQLLLALPLPYAGEPQANVLANMALATNEVPNKLHNILLTYANRVCSPHSQKATPCIAAQILLDLQSSLRKLHWEEATRCISALRSYYPLRASLATARLHFLSGDLHKALITTQRLLKLISPESWDGIMQVEDTLEIFIETMLLQGYILQRGGSPEEALNPTAAALALCQFYNIKLLQAVGQMFLARLLLRLQKVQCALRMAKHALPVLLSSANSAQRAEGCLTYAMILLAARTEDDATVTESETLLSQSVDLFTRSGCLLELRDALYTHVLLLNHMGKVKERNQISRQYNSVNEKCKGHQSLLLP